MSYEMRHFYSQTVISPWGVRVWPIVFFLSLFALALFFGVIATTANPIVLAMSFGLIVGAVLIWVPLWLVWIILLLGLFFAGIVPIWAEGHATKIVWAISLLGILLLVNALARVAVGNLSTKNTPSFVWLTLIFLLYVIVNGVFHYESAVQFFSGSKSYFQVIGLLFALSWLSLAENVIRRWRMLFLVLALVQLPWAVYELAKLVPLRENLRHVYPLLVPIDIVAGTFGANLHSGGANGEMAAFLIMILAFVVSRWRMRLLSNSHFMMIVLIVIAPLFMGETKAVIIMLPLSIIVLYRKDIFARPHLALTGLVLGALLTMAAGYAYLQRQHKNLDEYITDTLSYNVYNVGYGGRELNRTTVLTHWIKEQGLEDPISPIIGHGLGSVSETSGSQLSRRYIGFGIGLTGASTLLWEQGLLGFVLFISVLLFGWRAAGAIQRMASDPVHIADAMALQACLAVFVFFLFYRNALFQTLTFQIVFASFMGYMAWLYRCNALSNSHK